MNSKVDIGTIHKTHNIMNQIVKYTYLYKLSGLKVVDFRDKNEENLRYGYSWLGYM